MDGLLFLAALYAALAGIESLIPAAAMSDRTRGRLALAVLMGVAGLMQFQKAAALVMAPSAVDRKAVVALSIVGSVRLLAGILLAIERTARGTGVVMTLVMGTSACVDVAQILWSPSGLPSFSVLVAEGKSILMKGALLFWLYYFVLRNETADRQA